MDTREPLQRHVSRAEGSLNGVGATALYWQAWLPVTAPRAVVAIAHGGLEHGGRYGHVGRRFADAGVATYAIDFRGHGRSAGRRGQVERMSLLVDDLDGWCGSSASGTGACLCFWWLTASVRWSRSNT